MLKQNGPRLLNELSTATGLPDDLIGGELTRLIETAGKSPDSVTLDDLRDMLASYLQDVLLDAKDAFNGEHEVDLRHELQAAAEMLPAALPITISMKTKTTKTKKAAPKSPTFTMFSSLGSRPPDFVAEG